MTKKKSNNYLHHLAVGIGFAGLIIWYYIGKELGFLDWMIQLMPVKYAGAGMMLGIMIMMTPGFFIWSRYNRWIEKKLKVKGMYYEDEYYKEQDALKEKKKKTNQ